MAAEAESRGGWKGWLRRPAVLLALSLVALASLMSLIGRLTKPQEAKVRPLSDEPGTELYAALSPDGRDVAYSGRASSGEDSFHIFVRAAAGGAPRQLTRGDGSDVSPAWSPDGRTLVFARLRDGGVRYLTTSPAGGAEKVLAEFEGFSESHLRPAAAWTADGKSLAVVGRAGTQPAAILLLPEAGGAVRAVTAPPEASEGDTSPAISPDGKTLAFIRRGSAETADIFVTDLAGGAPRRVTFDDHQIRGIAWTADGREIVFSSNRGQGWRLWRVPAVGGSPREIQQAGNKAQYPSVARGGERMVFSESPNVAAIWRAELGKTGSERSLIRSSGRESAPAYSPGGDRIAYLSDQSGTEEVWTANADGMSPKQVTSFKGMRLGRPRWSPDGARLVLDVRDGPRSDIYTVPAVGGKPLRLTTSGTSGPSWSHDGKWIYYGQRQVWRMKPDGSGAEQLTRRGGSNPVESPDGKWVYYHRAREIWRIPPGGGEEEPFFQPEHNLMWGTLTPVKQRLYYMEWDYGARTASISFYDLTTKKAETLLSMKRAEFDRGASFSVSPDGVWVVYPRMDQTETNLMLVDGFR